MFTPPTPSLPPFIPVCVPLHAGRPATRATYNQSRHKDDLRALLLDSKDPFVSELAETDLVPETQQSNNSPHGSPARDGAAFPPIPPPRGGGGGGSFTQGADRSLSSPPGRVKRRGSDRGGGLANATTVSSLFRRWVHVLSTLVMVVSPPPLYASWRF